MCTAHALVSCAHNICRALPTPATECLVLTIVLVLRGVRMQDASQEYVGSRISTVNRDGYNQLTSTSVGTFTHHKLSNQVAGTTAPYSNAGGILLCYSFSTNN